MEFDFQNEIRLTKDFILSKVSEEQIMYFYLKIPINSKKLFKSPLRADKHNTCSLYKNSKGTLYFKDFATSEHLDVFNFVMTLFNCDYFTALKIIANDFGIIKDSSLNKNKGKVISKDFKIDEKEFSKIQIEAQDFSDLELKWWAKYGITLDILKKYNVYSCKHVFLNDQLIAKSQQHCPIFGYYGKKYQGNELWRIYFPKNKNCKFIGNWPSKKIQGLDYIPKSGKLLCITKSLKDCMTLYSLGIPAIAPNSETQFISESVLNDLKNRFKYIVVLFDTDQTGISFMNKIKKQHPELIYTWIPRKYGAKDISDYYKENGKNKTLNLIKEFLLWLKNRENLTLV